MNGIGDIGYRPLWDLLDLQPQHNAHNELNRIAELHDRLHRRGRLLTYERRCDRP